MTERERERERERGRERERESIFEGIHSCLDVTQMSVMNNKVKSMIGL